MNLPTTVEIASCSFVIARSHPFIVNFASRVEFAQTKQEALDIIKRTRSRAVCFIDTATDTVWDVTGKKSYNATDFFTAWRAFSAACAINQTISNLIHAKHQFPTLVSASDETIEAYRVAVPTTPTSPYLKVTLS